MSQRWNVGESPSVSCSRDRHEECVTRGIPSCTCRCHHFMDNGLTRVDEGCVPDCPYNGTNDAPCLCGDGCEGHVV